MGLTNIKSVCATHKTFRFLLALCIIFTANIPSAFAVEGDISWGGWEFTYSTNSTVGLELKDVTFQDRKILHKVNFPVMRVDYDNDVCGPYADILWTNAYVPIELSPPYDSCNGDGFCARTYKQDGNDYLEVGVSAELGEYDIYQSYIFSPDGFFDSYVFSRGLQCETDHRHHAHWMYDFDIDGRDNDQVMKNSGNLQTSEFNDRKVSTNYWTIKDAETGMRVELNPGNFDGFTDDFSQWDVAVRKWNSGETDGWFLGARGEIGDNYNNAESIDREDIVFWYVSHLDHKSLEGSTKWHSSGPRVQVFNPSPLLQP